MPVTYELIHQINGKGDIICRGQAPGAVRRKSEGKVLVMVITDAGQIVKNGAPEDLLHIRR